MSRLVLLLCWCSLTLKYMVSSMNSISTLRLSLKGESWQFLRIYHDKPFSFKLGSLTILHVGTPWVPFEIQLVWMETSRFKSENCWFRGLCSDYDPSTKMLWRRHMGFARGKQLVVSSLTIKDFRVGGGSCLQDAARRWAFYAGNRKKKHRKKQYTYAICIYVYIMPPMKSCLS